MVSEHMSQPYKFVCVDDSPFLGWWAKVSLFEPGRFSGRVLYLDLDVTVVSRLDDLADYPYPFAAIRDYQYPLQINSSAMTLDAGVADCVYNDFTPDVMERLHGDQNWVNKKIPDAARFPAGWCRSYRQECRFSVPKGTRVVVWHGMPKPWTRNTELVMA